MAADFKNVQGVKETDDALLCRIDGKEVWIPQSQIEEDSEVWKEGDYGTLYISDWFAEKEGLL